MNEPTVSVVIPAYNAEKYLKDTIDSVLAQTFSNWELIIVDDGSVDKTGEIAQKQFGDKRISYFKKENGGVSEARNYGIKRAKGKYVAFLDADDCWIETKLAKQIRALECQEEIRACYTAFNLVNESLESVGKVRSVRHSSALEDLIILGNVVATPSTVVAEKELFEMVGGFDPEFSLCADWEMWIRLATHTEFLYIDEPLLKYRLHDSNMSNNATLLETDTLRLLDKAFSLPDLPNKIVENRNSAYGKNYMVFAGTYFRSRMFRDFLRCSYTALKFDFTQVGYLVSFPARLLRRWAGAVRK